MREATAEVCFKSGCGELRAPPLLQPRSSPAPWAAIVTEMTISECSVWDASRLAGGRCSGGYSVSLGGRAINQSCSGAPRS
ncbi:unnamed protein product [Lota lota]